MASAVIDFQAQGGDTCGFVVVDGLVGIDADGGIDVVSGRVEVAEAGVYDGGEVVVFGSGGFVFEDELDVGKCLACPVLVAECEGVVVVECGVGGVLSEGVVGNGCEPVPTAGVVEPGEVEVEGSIVLVVHVATGT